MERIDDTDEVVDGGGLLGGLTAYHLRMLCESGWNGGAGRTERQVGEMTLDQIWSRLCDIEMLKRGVGERTERMDAASARGALEPDGDGMVRGRAADGTPILGRIGGKSVARQLMEKQEAERKKKVK